ncbi:hypothetical protein TOPH_06797 [Tolypocladium ophioglossoides CBS 100239]|uniref:Uncharacterized protein n=1 Tax=Tolypocladium ophioglossoides (strain CBS 100239) TaxID=1163406 RepID=A0A0L0N3H0_TOLOC|nr:hypothetical protein TOPH_06797 [Tolypocladium ophioglossoides CBS 100239]
MSMALPGKSRPARPPAILRSGLNGSCLSQADWHRSWLYTSSPTKNDNSRRQQRLRLAAGSPVARPKLERLALLYRRVVGQSHTDYLGLH